MISNKKKREREQTAALKTDLKSDPRKFHKQNPQGSGREDRHSKRMSSRNQSKSLIESIYIESQNQSDCHSRANL